MARISSALDIAQISDPVTPVAGRQFLYFKSDGAHYTKRPDGSVAAFVTTDATQTITGTKTFSAGTTGFQALTATSLATTGTVTSGGFDFILGTNDQVSRGATGTSRAMVKNTGAVLVINYAGDFTGGVQVQSTLSSTGNLSEGANRVYSLGNKVPIAGLSATGTADATTYLRGDNTWVAAVDLASTQTISGNKTFSGTLTATNTSTFTSPQFVNTPTTGIGNAGSQTSLISPPFAYGIWNDKLRFTLPSVVEIASTPISPPWTTTGAPTAAQAQSILAGRTDLGGLTLTAANPGMRLTWNNTGMNFGQMTNLLFCWTYAAPFLGSITITWESSADGVSWTSRGTTTQGGLSAVWLAMPVADHGGDGYFRLTMLGVAPPPATPVTSAATPSTTGGTLAAGTYYYVVTATNAYGQGGKSNEVSAVTTGTTGSVSVPFVAGTGGVAPTSYSLYRGTAPGAENVLVATGSASPLIDPGGAGSAATPPASQPTAFVRSFQARTGRPGDQGSGEQANLPFNWAGDRTVSFLNAVTVNGTLNSTGTLSEGGTRVYSVNNKVPVAGLSATGTANSTSYLRGDNTWATNVTTTDTTQTISGNKTFTGTVVIGNKALWAGTRTITATATDTVDIGSFSSTNGAMQLNIMCTVNGAAYSVSKTYEIDVAASTGTASTWYKVLPQDATQNSSAAIDFALEVNRNATSNTYSFRIRQVGTTAGTLFFQAEGWGDNSVTFTPSTTVTAAPAAVSVIWAPTPLYTGPGRVGINTDNPAVELDVVGTVNGTQIQDTGSRVYSTNNKVPVAGLSATGTANATTYLRGDNTWTTVTAAPPVNMTSRAFAMTVMGS